MLVVMSITTDYNQQSKVPSKIHRGWSFIGAKLVILINDMTTPHSGATLNCSSHSFKEVTSTVLLQSSNPELDV